MCMCLWNVECACAWDVVRVRARVCAATAVTPWQVLVVSNYHWLANADAWRGGHWPSEPENRALFLNLCASAVAFRERGVRGQPWRRAEPWPVNEREYPRPRWTPHFLTGVPS